MLRGTDDLTWTRGGQSGQPTSSEDGGYLLVTDVQLMVERDRQRVQLDRLTMSPGTSPAIGQVFASIEQEIERINDELIRRVLSRNPWSPAHSARSPR